MYIFSLEILTEINNNLLNKKLIYGRLYLAFREVFVKIQIFQKNTNIQKTIALKLYH